MLVVLGYYVWFRIKGDKKNILRAIGIVIIVILVVISIPAVKNNITKRLVNPSLFFQTSDYTRSGMMELCIDIFKENPITGIGSGNFATYAIENPYFYLGGYLEISENMAPHVFFLQLLAENGIFGFIAMVMIFLVLAKVLFEEKRYLEYRDSREYILGLRMLYLSFIVHLIFGYVAGGNRLIFGLMMGLSLSLLKKNHSIDSIKS
jgi:O-antigen ligase